MEWLTSHSPAITAVTSFCTLLVWLFYAQILFLNFRRERQPKIIINRGGGKTLQAHCVVSNMSPEAIFIEHIIAILHTDKGRYTVSLIDIEDAKRTESSRLVETTRQGPMAPGSFNHIGTFEEIIERVLHFHDIPSKGCDVTDDLNLEAIELRLVAVYGSEDAPIGALRKFELNMDEKGRYLTPTTLDTRRFASRLRRRKVRQWLREMND
jgi:hypothetical protein